MWERKVGDDLCEQKLESRNPPAGSYSVSQTQLSKMNKIKHFDGTFERDVFLKTVTGSFYSYW